MTESLKQRLLSIDRYKPYVWKMRLTEDEYCELQAYVKENIHIDRENAILAIIYIAEWYKREYDGNVANPLEKISAEGLWETSQFDKSTYVYKTNNTHRWLESIFMLGGLPMNYILHRNDTKLLKALCSLYKDENASLEDDKDIVNNLSRIVNIPRAFEYGDLKLIKMLFNDKIHEPYRKKLIKEYDDVKNILDKYDTALAISGSGSTMLVISYDYSHVDELLNKVYNVKRVNVGKGVDISED